METPTLIPAAKATHHGLAHLAGRLTAAVKLEDAMDMRELLEVVERLLTSARTAHLAALGLDG